VPWVGLLQLTVAALLCEARSLYAVAQWGRERLEAEPVLLERLGLPPGRSPCVATLHRVFKAVDVEACERAIGTWLAQTGVAPDDPIAVDGKTLRGVHGAGLPGEPRVAAYTHQAGAVLAQLRTPGKGHALAGATEVLAETAVQGRVVTTCCRWTTTNPRCAPLWRRPWALADPEVNAYVGSRGTHQTAWPHVQQVCRLERERVLVRAGRIVIEEHAVS